MLESSKQCFWHLLLHISITDVGRLVRWKICRRPKICNLVAKSFLRRWIHFQKKFSTQMQSRVEGWTKFRVRGQIVYFSAVGIQFWHYLFEKVQGGVLGGRGIKIQCWAKFWGRRVKMHVFYLSEFYSGVIMSEKYAFWHPTRNVTSNWIFIPLLLFAFDLL